MIYETYINNKFFKKVELKTVNIGDKIGEYAVSNITRNYNNYNRIDFINFETYLKSSRMVNMDLGYVSVLDIENELKKNWT